MLDLRQVKSFTAVAREGSLTRAAAVLHYAQSSVTAQIKALEEEVGAPLFDRIGRGLSLTTAGTQFLAYAERLLALEQEARTSAAGGQPSGRLTIASSESLLTYRLPDLLRTFQGQYPAVEIALQATSVCGVAAVVDAAVDLSITIDEMVQDPSLMVETLRTEPMVSAVWAGHPLSDRKRVTAADICEFQILLTERSCSYRALFERSLAQSGTRIARSLELASVEAIKQCALARMGIAVLPQFVLAEELRKGTLIALPWPARGLEVYTQILRRKDKWFSPAMQAFWQGALKQLRPAAVRRQNVTVVAS